MKEKKNTLLIAGTYVATVIGAGFASGQEILSYFVVYGKRSVYGLMIVCVLFILCALCVMLRTYNDGIEGFDEYMSTIASKRVCAFMKICIMLFMFSSFCSMVAGNGELFYNIFKTPRIAGSAVMLFACAVVFFFDLKGILTVNAVLAPIMAISLFVLGVYSFIFRDISVFSGGFYEHLCKNYFVSALVYASYNLLSAIVILSGLRPLITRRSVCFASSIIGGGALIVIAAAMWAAIGIYYGKIELYDMPFLTIASRRGTLVKSLYSLVLCFSMLTTAISCGYGVLGWLSSRFKIKKLTAIVVLIVASVPITFLGFSQIVKNIYSIFGYLGLVMIVCVLSDGIRLMNEK